MRLETVLEDAYTFKLLNELANVMRKHDRLSTAIQLYKKALLSIKMRFKNDYLSQRDTSKILINIASTEYIRDNLSESLRYYEHALNVIKSCKEFPDKEVGAQGFYS
jgi:tetratricopeptide (TPR) repeat protein